MKNNHYYRFYLKGLNEVCCFNYMKEKNYEFIKNKLNRIEIYTTTLTSFVENCENAKYITKFILLDSQDWREQYELTNDWAYYYKYLNNNCEFFWRSSAPKQCHGVLENLDFKLKCSINLDKPNNYTDRIAMYRSVYHAKFNKNMIIPTMKDNFEKISFLNKIYVFKSMISFGFLYKNKNDSHEEFLNKFYKNQASLYDAYRREMLHGKKKLMFSIPYKKNSNILLVAGGTGDILDYISDIIEFVNKITIVDLSKPLLQIAQNRIKKNLWEEKVELIHADVTNFNNKIKYDLVIITYSLTMILDWKKTLDNINNLLKENGFLAISDFGITQNQNYLSKLFWKNIFNMDNIYLNEDHWKYTDSKYIKIFREFDYGTFPLIPFIKCPYYYSLHKKCN